MDPPYSLLFRRWVSVLRRLTTAASLTALATATATATTTDRGRAGEEAAVQGRRAAALRRTLDITTTAAVLLVGLRRQLEDLAELHALVGLHRLLNVGEPGSHFV